MTTMTTAQLRYKTPVADQVRAYLLGLGYDPATVERARRDESALSPAHAAAVRDLVTALHSAPPAPPDLKVNCIEWAYDVLEDPVAPARWVDLATGLLNEEDVFGRRFVPPTLTESDRRDVDRRVASRAVARGAASTRPTPCGLGLTAHEHHALWEVESAEVVRTGYDFAAGRRARAAAFQALLAVRTAAAESATT